MRKAQMTLFAIVGIILAIVLGIILFSSNSINKQELNADDAIVLKKQGEQIKAYVEECLLDISAKGVFNKIGPQGGYIDPEYNEHYGDYDQVEWERSGFLKIPYWYYNGKDISPSLDKIEEKLRRYILVEGINCTSVENLESLKGTEIIMPTPRYQKTYLDFSLEKKQINVSINNEDITVKYYFPITLKRGETSKTIEDYFIRLPIAYGNDYRIAKKILKKMIDNKEEGYNIEPDCWDLNRRGNTNIYYFNQRIMLNDYETYVNPKFQRTFTLQFLYSGLTVYGYCSG